MATDPSNPQVLERQEILPTPYGVPQNVRSAIPSGSAFAQVAILHGYGDHSGRYLHLMRHLARERIAAHALDFRGHALSGGKRLYIHQWPDYLQDLQHFLQHLQQLDATTPIFILAHSHGGLIAAAAAIQGFLSAPHIRGVILSSPYFRNRVPVPWHKLLLAHAANRTLPWLKVKSGIPPEWLSQDPQMRQETLDDPHSLRCATPRWFLSMRTAQQEVLSRAAEFQFPLLMLLAGADPIADNAASRDFFSAASSPDKRLIEFPDMLHEILREREREKVLNILIPWIHERTGVINK